MKCEVWDQANLAASARGIQGRKIKIKHLS